MASAPIARAPIGSMSLASPPRERDTMRAAVDRINRLFPTLSPSISGGSKRRFTLHARSDSVAGDAERQSPAKKRAPPADLSADAGALVPYLAPPDVVEAQDEPMDAVPLAAPPATNLSAEAGALVEYVAPPAQAEPIDAVPLAVSPPANSNLSSYTGATAQHAAPAKKRAKTAAAVRRAAAAPAREAPGWVREVLLPHLEYHRYLPVVYLDEKAVTKSDVDKQQARFRFPGDCAHHRLHPMLTPDEVATANLLPEEKEKRKPEPPATPPPADGAADEAQGRQRVRKKGKDHGGLPVVLVYASLAGGNLTVRIKKKLQLTKWSSSGGVVIKGEGYHEFVTTECGFEVDDRFDIWAFKQRRFRLFGKTPYEDHPLHVLIVKKDAEQRQSALPQ